MVNLDDDDPLLQEKQAVLAKLMTWFICTGEISIDDDLRVSVDGRVRALVRPFKNGVLPVRFKTCKGFYVDNSGLTSFAGSPEKIFGHAWYGNNRLTSLEHAPQEVHGYLGLAANRITSLDGLPTVIQGIALDYHPHMPLLKTLIADTIDFPHVNTKAPGAVERILNRYAGQGQAGALACAAELADAGYKENAQW